MVIVFRRLEVGATVRAKKRFRTATPRPIDLCSGPLIGFRIRAVMTASETGASRPSLLLQAVPSSAGDCAAPEGRTEPFGPK